MVEAQYGGGGDKEEDINTGIKMRLKARNQAGEVYIYIHTYTHREQLQIIQYDLIAVYVCEDGRDIDVNTGVRMRVKPE